MMINCRKVLSPQGWLENQTICIDKGIITTIKPQTSDASGSKTVELLAPGFIDIQVNGGGGFLLNQQTDANAVEQIFYAHQRFGTTAMLPTLITDSEAKMQEATCAIAIARKSLPNAIVGVHFEGPWLSRARKGVHPERYIRAPKESELAMLRATGLGQVLVTLAPENVAPAVIRELVEDGIIVFLGHSAATAEQTCAALDAGATGFTHLFNAMSPMQSREPGMVGAALAAPNAYAGLIVDGYHVDPICCKVAARALGKERICLVTDAMALAASEATQMPFFETTITKSDNRLTTPDGTLAGSCLTMIDAVRNTVKHCNIALEDALYMASTTPATALDLQQSQGSIAVGQQANFVALDQQLQVTEVYQAGQPTFENSGA
ncbi:N-acetylglucosamine-6-phosphate deacetylase [Alteromonas sp. ASW11-36]|uniref:N-acetylgalactosamine-6-phosphate deacetylase n=1 Tax=Alteromonas arenosi TaxID=3055817 RepID=A0ABT7SUA0_9ALTE|nr:N-acetylglucosamine-6-phosphate deacetylase [Alteromonas sp. ASW11-36]MDM7859094.1 N-acetylglucosamine-6-phosphate deacetylase [Alteromonas sp. ASW11-36]